MMGFDFDEAVFGYYIKHGEPCTAKELEEFAGVPESRVRKVINSNDYYSDCVTVDRWATRCFRRVNAHSPTKAMLRRRIVELEQLQQTRCAQEEVARVGHD
jgi:hypothetical protein